ncbi:MAG: hypothetical protein MZW92_10410 [Comamonadaceae bacterium]|nr:hypothetical protein [Comamonadaceae bacterium]
MTRFGMTGEGLRRAGRPAWPTASSATSRPGPEVAAFRKNFLDHGLHACRPPRPCPWRPGCWPRPCPTAGLRGPRSPTTCGRRRKA